MYLKIFSTPIKTFGIPMLKTEQGDVNDEHKNWKIYLNLQ